MPMTHSHTDWSMLTFVEAICIYLRRRSREHCNLVHDKIHSNTQKCNLRNKDILLAGLQANNANNVNVLLYPRIPYSNIMVYDVCLFLLILSI